MDDLTKLRHQLEYFILKDIVTSIKNNSMNENEAREYAAAFVKVEPFASVEDAQQKMDQFAQKYTRFTRLKEYADGFKQEQQADAKVEQMREHLKTNNIDAALQVAKG